MGCTKQRAHGGRRQRVVHCASRNSEPAPRGDVGTAAHFVEHLAITMRHCAAARKQGGRRAMKEVAGAGDGETRRPRELDLAGFFGSREEYGVQGARRHGEREEIPAAGAHGRRD
jgi:hypothetical protein